MFECAGAMGALGMDAKEAGNDFGKTSLGSVVSKILNRLILP